MSGGNPNLLSNWYKISFESTFFGNISLNGSTGELSNSSIRVTSSLKPIPIYGMYLKLDNKSTEDDYIFASIGFFDKYNNFISGISYSNSNETVLIPQIPENSYYYRISIKRSTGLEISQDDNFSLIEIPFQYSSNVYSDEHMSMYGINVTTQQESQTDKRLVFPLNTPSIGLYKFEIFSSLINENLAISYIIKATKNNQIISSEVTTNLFGSFIKSFDNDFDKIIIVLKKSDGSGFTEEEISSILINIKSYYLNISPFSDEINYKNLKTINISQTLDYGQLQESDGCISSLSSSYKGNRLCSAKYLKIIGTYNKFININIPEDCDYNLKFYDTNKNFISTSNFSTPFNSGWISHEYTSHPIPNSAAFFKIQLKKSDNSIISKTIVDFNCKYLKEEINFESYNKTQNSISNPSIENLINISTIIELSNPLSCATEDISVQDNFTEKYLNYGILRLPQNYTPEGSPVPLIIFCHGYSGHYFQYSTVIASTSDLNVDYLLKEGFAVMDMDGSVINSNYPHVCSDMAIEAYIQGYNWVIDRFNVTKDVYLAGHSEGGMMAALLTNIGNSIPIKATVLFAPANSLIMLMQLHPEHRSIMAQYYGFEGTEPTWGTNTTFSQEELEYIYSNFDKFKKSGLFWSCVSDIDKEVVKTLNTNFMSNPSEETKNYYNTKSKIINKVPIKIFHGTSDASCLVQYSYILYNMLKNAGIYSELRIMEGVTHTGTNGIVSVGNNEVTTIFGEKLTEIPTALIEMIRFFRRF